MHEATIDLPGRAALITQRLCRPDFLAHVRFAYQPIVCLTGRTTVGVESLARWTDPQLGEVAPADFVPIADDTGRLPGLTTRALMDGMEVVRGGGFLSVNVDVTGFCDPTFPGRVLDACTMRAFPPDRLLLEVTETGVIREPDWFRAAMTTLQRAGVRIAADDLGAGLSTLARVIEYPFDVVKLDRALIRLIHTGRGRRALCRALELVHELGAVAVAEGIEDVATAERCAGAGADLGQGWLFGRPAPAGRAPVS
ncbi:EAL domain-containing protein [Pseudonocardia sp. NPDC046786]|uniref:EAL domain-containing protein n=1 Tax=Pseudonocardia sp. NPDC046786 TaxID=3155471 RepID=UPI0033D8CAC2